MARTGVIVIGGAGIDRRVLTQLPGDRYVVAADSGFDHALAPGLTEDLLVGDLDSISGPGRAAADAAGTVIERHRPDKDATDTELAVAAALSRGVRHLVGVSGGPRADETRLDHELGGILAFTRPDLGAETVEVWWGPCTTRRWAGSCRSFPSMGPRSASPRPGCATRWGARRSTPAPAAASATRS